VPAKKIHILMISILFLFALNVHGEQKPSFDEIKQQAEQGEAMSQAKLGALYHLGENVQLPSNARFEVKNKFKAVEYLFEGIEQNDKKATKWLLKAADQGLVEAEVFMAARYDRGMGVNQNSTKATDLYKKASAHGNTTAEAILGRYANTRIMASKAIPFEYAIKILNLK
jgi:TPR repeat protein